MSAIVGAASGRKEEVVGQMQVQGTMASRPSARGRAGVVALTCLVAATMLGLCGRPAYAAPSVLGPTGVVVAPDAAAVPRGNVEGFMRRGGGDDEWWSIGANVGVAEGVEVGFVRIDPEQAEADTAVNLKVVFPPANPGDLPVALGVWDITNELSRTYYAVAGIGPFLCGRKQGDKANGEGRKRQKWESLVERYCTPQLMSVGFGKGEEGGALDGAFIGLNLGVLALDWNDGDFNAAMRLGARAGLDWGWVDGDFFLGVWGSRPL